MGHIQVRQSTIVYVHSYILIIYNEQVSLILSYDCVYHTFFVYWNNCPTCALGDDESMATKGDDDKVDQVINSISVHSTNVGETAASSQGMLTVISNLNYS